MNLPPLPKFDEWIAQAYREPHERFTKYNMEVAYQAGRKQALEEAAKVCETFGDEYMCQSTTSEIVKEIRELK